MRSGLMLGTKHEDIKLLAHIENAEYSTAQSMSVYFRESYQNYRLANGHIYSSADLDKLELEKRPAFVYNLFRPILLQLAGNFKSNMGKVEALPRTPGDFKMANITNDLLDYALMTANNVEYQLVMSYINAIIGRIGWIYGDWRYDLDPDGMYWLENYNPFRVLFDTSYATRNTKKWDWIIDRGFYSVEEIRNIFSANDMDLWDEITEKAKIMMGDSDVKNRQILSMMERITGMQVQYKGKDTGYDEFDAAFTQLNYGNTEYYNSNTGKFKVIDFHERRSEQVFVASLQNGDEFDITGHVNSLVKKAKESFGSGYRNAIVEIRDRMIAGNFGEPTIERRVINQMYQTAVCPSLNLILSDEPYTVQNGNFKLIPVFCFEMGQDILDWKSYIDDITDPVRGVNLDLNTIQTYLMKTAQGETWYEEDALGEFEDDFKSNKINAYKKVKERAISGGKIKKIFPPALPPGLANFASIREDLVKKVSGIRDNAMGTAENSSESGKLFGQRVAQSDLLQIIPQDNAISQMKLIGENCADNLFHYLTPGRVIRIVSDETNPYWVQINGETINKLFFDKEGNPKGGEEIPGKLTESKYDIVISQVPYGQTAKDRQAQELMMLTEVALKIDRPDYVKFDYFVKSSMLKNKEEWLTHIQSVDQNMAAMAEQQKAEQEKIKQLGEAKEMANIQKDKFDLESKGIDNINKKRELDTDVALENAINQII